MLAKEKAKVIEETKEYLQQKVRQTRNSPPNQKKKLYPQKSKQRSKYFCTNPNQKVCSRHLKEDTPNKERKTVTRFQPPRDDNF